MNAPQRLAPAPDVCFVTDVCAHLRISRRQFFYLRRPGQPLATLPELLPRLGKRQRFDGRWIREYLEGRGLHAPSRHFASHRPALVKLAAGGAR